MADIFSEVEEGLRQDRASALWKKYGPIVIGAAVLLVAAVAVWEYMRWSRAEAIEASATEYSTAMDLLESDDTEAAEQAFGNIAAGDGGFAALAAHMAASAAEASGDTESAIEHFETAAAKTDNIYADLAVLKGAYLQADTVGLAELEAIVAPILTGSGPTDALARELIAAKALAEGDIERARRDYQTLSLRLDDGSRLPAFQQRVQRALMVLPPAAAPAATETPTEDAGADAPGSAEPEDAPAQ